jgi:GntR family transcriptional regulator
VLIDIDVHGGVPIYRQVIEQVRRLIMTGQMPEGEQVESVNKLSSRLKVNPMTISKAYSFLVQEGLLERRRGVGLFVAQLQRDAKDDIKDSLLGEALRKAAYLAVQMDVGEREAVALFEKHFRQVKSQKERKSQ